MTVLTLSVFFLSAMTGIVVIGGVAAMKLSHKRKIGDNSYRSYN
jgi:hypothetical protein